MAVRCKSYFIQNCQTTKARSLVLSHAVACTLIIDRGHRSGIINHNLDMFSANYGLFEAFQGKKGSSELKDVNVLQFL